MILTKVTGTTFNKRQDTIKELYKRGILQKDALVTLTHEPECKFDSNARRCELSGYTIGYLDKEVAEICSIMAERGVYYIGIVDYIGTFDGKIGIRIALKRLE